MKGQHTLNAGLRYSFPLDELLQVAEDYVIRNKLDKYSEQCTEHFRSILAKQTFDDPTSRFATIIACLPVISPSGAREIFTSNIRFHSNITITSSFPLFIRAIVVAFRANRAAVSEHEAKCAEALGKLASSNTTLLGHPLRNFLQHYILLREDHLLIHQAIPQILKRACQRYADELESYEKNGKWFGAYVDSSWLATALNGSLDDIHEVEGDSRRANSHHKPILHVEGGPYELEGTSTTDRLCELDGTQQKNRTASWAEQQRIYQLNQSSTVSLNKNEDASQPRRRFTLRRNSAKASSQTSAAPIAAVSEESLPSSAVRTAPHTIDQTQAQRRVSDASTVPISPTMVLDKLLSNVSDISRPRFKSTASEKQQICTFLDEYMPQWKTWALWNPSVARIKRWNSLTTQQATQMRDLLSLEGRDSTGNGQSTFFDGLFSTLSSDSRGSRLMRHGKLRLECPQANPRASLDQLLQSLDLALNIGSSAVGLFAELCMKNSPDITAKEAMETMTCCGDPKTGRAVYDLLTSNSNAAQMTAITRLLPLLNDSERMRAKMFPQIASRINSSLQTAQDVLVDQISKNRTGQAIGMRIFEFGQALQETKWLKSYFDDSTVLFLTHLPTADELNAVFKHRTAIAERDGALTSDKTSDFIMSRLAGQGEVTSQAAEVVSGVTNFWQNSPDSDRHAVAMALLRMPHLDPNVLKYCLEQLHTLPDWCVRDLEPILADDDDMSCVNFAALLVKIKDQKSINHDALLQLFVHMLEPGVSGTTEFMGTLASGLSIRAWFEWTSNLNGLLSGEIPFFEVSPELRQILSWSECLSVQFMPALNRLRDICASSFDLRWIVLKQSTACESLLDHLSRRKSSRQIHIEEIILSRMSGDGTNADIICRHLQTLQQASGAGLDACSSILRRHESGSTQVAEALVAGWKKSRRLESRDLALLETLSCSLPLRAASQVQVEEAMNFFAAEYMSLVEQANGFERARIKLRRNDPARTKKLLSDLGVEESSTLTTDVSLDIPMPLINYVELIEPSTYELAFPLPTLRPVQCKALGITKSARMVIIRLVVKGDFGVPEYCVHFHPDPHLDVDKHSHHHWRLAGKTYQGAPDRVFCGKSTSRGLYQINRALWELLSFEFQSLEATYASIQAVLESLTQSCIVCRTPLRQQSLRSTTCSTRCSDMFRRADLSVRASDMVVDPPVTEFLLTIAHSAAMTSSGDMNLLLDCPLAQNEVVDALEKLPALPSIQASTLATQVSNSGPNSELLLSWVSTSYRGFLVSATESLRIPSLPGVHQFLLANASPEKERSFATHAPQTSTTILFHGTSIDRLWRIISEGLIIGAQTSLMVHVGFHFDRSCHRWH